MGMLKEYLTSGLNRFPTESTCADTESVSFSGAAVAPATELFCKREKKKYLDDYLFLDAVGAVDPLDDMV